MEQYIGKLLDNRYEILEVVGTGGMAVVYKARCHRLNRLVAVKILKPEIAQDEELRRRFRDESQAVAMLSHPNIVAVYDVSRSSDIEYIVMELIDGITLKQYMHQKGGVLNWKEALHYTTQIMKALGHAHSRGIIHRDIKPHNIMVLKDGSVKVADFGIARVVASQHTLTQEALGSVHYISPEQARGSHIDARADIYSAGVVLYEMLTGRLPYEGDSPVSVAIQHINSVPLSPRELNPEIPEALEAITMKAMASSLERRYINADAMLADLEEFRKNPNISFDYDLAPVVAVVDDEPTQVIRRERPGHHPKEPNWDNRDDDDDEDEEYYPASRSGRRGNRAGVNFYFVGAVAAVFVFVIGIAFMLWTSIFSDLFAPAVEHIVPDLVGSEYQAVITDPQHQKFRIIVSEYRASETVAEGCIIDQTPNAFATAKGDNPEIRVIVSSGIDYVPLGTYVNQEYRTVLSELSRLGLRPRAEGIADEAVTPDHVISTSPAEGSFLRKGDEVVIYYSKGPNVLPVKVIPFVGLTLEQALAKMDFLELELGLVEEVDSDQLAGVIVEQSIAVDEEVPVGTAINFQISRGNGTGTGTGTGTTPVPGVPNTPLPDARQKYIRVELPFGEGTVKVVITVDGQSVYDREITMSGTTMSVPVMGRGVQEVAIYLDGQLKSSSKVDFSA